MSVDNGATYPYDSVTKPSFSSPSSGVTAGSGGGDMAIWTADRLTQLRNLANGTYSNSSSYSLPSGVVDPAYRTYDDGLQNNAGVEHGLSQSSGAESGTGGGLMDIWTADRQTRLSTLCAAGTYENKAEDGELPHGIVDSTRNYDVGIQNNNGAEEHLGVGFVGQAIAPDGSALTGEANVEADGDTLVGETVSGTFIASLDPHHAVAAIIEGANGSNAPDSMTTMFTPLADALGVTQSNQSWPRGSFMDVTYGYIAGYVYDVYGDPVSSETITVVGENAGSATDSEGWYSILAPDARTLSLKALELGVTKDKSAVGGQTVHVDYQYGGVVIQLRGPNGNPLPNAPVNVGGTDYRSNNSGEVVDPRLGIGKHTVTLFQSIDREAEVLDEGHLDKIEYDGGSVISLTVRDATNARPVEDLPAIDTENGIVTYSSDRGTLRLPVPQGGQDRTLRLADSDRRYKTKNVTTDIADGETLEIEEFVPQDTVTTNY